MPSKKVGKQRLDKYYHLAKEHGFRARSAYKLLQLDQKFNLLKTCTSVIDLCAAPGGWLQVASSLMPIERTIIGVDLSPIKPLPGVTTIRSDITQPSCAVEIKRLISECDLVLHDGAPNVGTDWDYDAYIQNILVLSAIKLASNVLKKNGTFITKIFRSRDYASLLWLFERIFNDVVSTKPLSSRGESAEIFVVCRGYLKPVDLDQKFFDPEYIFGETAEKKSQYGILPFSVFLNDEYLLKLLKIYAKIDINSYEFLFDADTKELVNDLKLVNVGDLRKIVRVRDKIVRLIKKDENYIELRNLLPEELPKEIQNENENDTDWKLDLIKQDLKKNKKKIKKLQDIEKLRKAKNKIYELPDDEFFEDKLFINEVEVSSSEDAAAVDESEDTEESDDSESFDIEEKDIPKLVKMKKNPEEFALSTVDRNVRGNENLPEWYLEEEEEFNARNFDEESEEVRTPKKQMEALNRRKKRAMRFAEKMLDNENEEEKQKNISKVMRKAFKKTKQKPMMIWPVKGKITIPKTKRKVKLVDKRMKKEFRAMKRKNKR